MPPNLHIHTLRNWDLLFVVLPAVALLAAVLWIARQFVDPPPPRTLVLSAGQATGAYMEFARRYQKMLESDRVHLVVRESNGSVDNLQRLAAEQAPVDLAFVQSGTASNAGVDTSGLVALAAVYYEPLWIFHRLPGSVDKLHDLAGRRLALGVTGSGTRALALRLLGASGVAADPADAATQVGGEEAANGLLAGTLDAAFLMGAPEVPAIDRLLHTPGVQLMSFTQADAYTRLFPFLAHVVLPRGMVNLERDLPSRDVHLIAATAMLAAREDLHPLLVTLLLQTVTQVHGGAGWFHRAREFPSMAGVDLPPSEDAERFFKNGVPFLERYLPFDIAVVAHPLLILGLPLLAVLLPLLQRLPPIYTWRVRRRIYRWYGDLRAIEHEFRHSDQRDRLQEWSRRLDRVEEKAMGTRVPLAFYNEFYLLHQHIELVRTRLHDRFGSPAAAAPGAA